MFLKRCTELFLLFPLFIIAQNQEHDTKAIDVLLSKSEIAYKNLDDTKCLEYAKKAGELAIKASDSKREAQSYFIIARVLATLHMQKESILFVKKAEALGFANGNTLQLAELMEVKSFNYRSLGLDTHFLQADMGIIRMLKKDQSINSLKIQARAYANIGSYYYEHGVPDSAFAYLKKQERILKRIPEREIVVQLSEFYDGKGYVFLENNNADSAFYYFKKGYAFKQKYKDPLLYVQYCAFGDYYLGKGETRLALDYYLKTIQNINEFNVKNTNYISVYKSISELYGKLNQSKNEILYLKKYTRLNDSINALKDSKVDNITNVVLKENEQRLDSNKKATILIILAIVILSALLFYFTFSKYQRAKKSSIKNKQLVLQKEKETKDLKLKLNESFDELIQLAKTNDYNFYTRFQEVYPEFQNRLLLVNPTLQIPELTLSAYIYLDFQAKEIADYTFKSLRTIQNRKNRLRKKLNLSSTENLNVWFKNLMANPD